MTSLIEKLELLIKNDSWEHEHANGDIEKLVSVDDLRAIIESAKSESQEPVCFANPDDVDMKTYPNLAFNFPVRSKKGGEFTQPLSTHPPLSDETVKDAEIAKLVKEKLTSGNDVPVSRCVITKEEIDKIIGA